MCGGLSMSGLGGGIPLPREWRENTWENVRGSEVHGEYDGVEMGSDYGGGPGEVCASAVYVQQERSYSG